MSEEDFIIHKYKGFDIKTERCSYPTYSVALDPARLYVRICGVKKLKTIKVMIDVYVEGKNERS